MIDHILVYPDDAACAAAWPAPVDNEGNPTGAPSWTGDTGHTVLPTRAVVERAIYNEQGELTSPEIVAPGAWVIVRTLRADDDLSEQAVIVFSDGVMIKNTLPENPGQFDPIWAGTEYDYSK